MNRPHPEPSDPRQNQLLASLPEAEWARLCTHLERVELPLGAVLCDPGCTAAHPPSRG